MGSTFELIVVEKDEEIAALRLEEGIDEIRRLEALLTEFDPASQTSLINSNAGRPPIPIDPECYALIERCIHLSRITQGAFDITAIPLRNLYNFKERIANIPDPATLAATLSNTGYHHIQLANGRIALLRSGMRIAFGAIGKGYAADALRTRWKNQGLTAGVINASGDLTAWGLRPDGSPWKIGIADPRDPSRFLLWLPIHDAAIATSGNYEQFFEIDGVRFSHNIDPRTGIPVKEIKSVSIISPSAELSDALATAVTVMGVDPGLHLLDQLPDTHGIIIDNKDRIHTSKNIAL
jgi:thiamine biosynthesis lipoprotein